MTYKKRGTAFLGVVAVVMLAGCGTNTSTPENVALAQCLSDQGVVFYGAEWCPHCTTQKNLFGTEAIDELPYVECDPNLDPVGAQACELAGVESFPTWKFADGTTLRGTQNLDTLANIAGCDSNADVAQDDDMIIMDDDAQEPTQEMSGDQDTDVDVTELFSGDDTSSETGASDDTPSLDAE